MKWIAFTLLMLTIVACESPDQVQERARSAAQQGNLDEARTLYEKLKYFSNEDPIWAYKSQFGLSEVAAKEGKVEDQAQILQTLLDNAEYQANHPVVREILEDNLLNRAEKKRAGNEEEALELYQAALKVNPESVASKQLGQMYLDRAKEAMSVQDFKSADQAYVLAEALNIKDEKLLNQVKSGRADLEYKSFLTTASQLFNVTRSELEKEGIYSHETKTFFFKLTVDVEGRVNKKNRDQLTKKGKALAEEEAGKKVAEILKRIFNVTQAAPFDPKKSSVSKSELARKSKRVKKGRKRVYVTKYTYQFSLPTALVYELAYRSER